MRRLATPALAIVVFLLNAWLNGPLFFPGELPFRGSIEGGYVGMARFVSQHPNPWGWNPFQYCGLPTQFMYVPVVPYLAGLWIHLLPHASPDHVYRLIVATAACLGPVTVFLFALHFTGSRGWSFAAALFYSFISPSYQFFPAVEKDRGLVQLPWRIQVLAKYGEGPHNVGLALMPLTLLAVWRAGLRRGYSRILLAAVMLAVVPLVNWIAAFALAIACVLLLSASAAEPEFRAWRVLAASGLGYLLACFWLTPTFVRTIVFNWPTDSFAYHFGSPQRWLVAGLAAGTILIRLVFLWRRGPFYFCFVTLGAFVFGWIATAFYLYGADTVPESRRYAIEFELFLALALVEAFRLTLESKNQTTRMCAWGAAAVVLLMGGPQLWSYATQGWRRWMPVAPETTVEYRLAQWIAQHPPQGRVLASGGLRFRLNSWFDIPQVGGAFETGLRNRTPWELAYRIRTMRGMQPGREAEETLQELKTSGAQYVVVHGPKSREYYRDFAHPERLADWTAVYHLEDDTIYTLPSGSLAHLVSPAELPEKDAVTHSWMLAPYVAAIDDSARPKLSLRWLSATRLVVDGPVSTGRVVSVQVNADPGWTAVQDGREIAVEHDELGFVVLRAAPSSNTHIELQYRGTAEPRIMAAVSGTAWLAALTALFWSRDRRGAVAA